MAPVLDPARIGFSSFHGKLFYLAGRYDEAIEQLTSVLDLDPDYDPARLRLGFAYAKKGMYREAELEARKVAHPAAASALSLTAHVSALSGKKQQAEEDLGELMALSRRQYVSALAVAVVYAGLRDEPGLFRWLERAYEERSFGLYGLGCDPVFEEFRAHPRFRSLLERLHAGPRVCSQSA